MSSIYLYIIVSAVTLYLIRVLPLVVFKKPITNKFFKSFLYYVPYVTLAVMTVPAIFTIVPDRQIIGIIALAVGIVGSLFTKNLFIVASSCCIVVFVLQFIF